ncbi:MAG: hypothetical protein Q4B03_05995 [Lachnospiraceae bacterium]|nr:hypothetical protein [Lachnospiraceae bacterium]
MKERKINYLRMLTVISILYIAATLVGEFLNNRYMEQYQGSSLTSASILMNTIPVLAAFLVFLSASGILRIDERLPYMFYSLISVSFGLIQVLYIVFSLGGEISVYYIINVVSILFQMAAAVVMILLIIGKSDDHLGVSYAWTSLVITVILFMTSLSIYDTESILYISLFPQIASVCSTLMLLAMFYRLRENE